MSWLNRLCIRRLAKAVYIAEERLRFAQLHLSHGEVALRIARLSELKARIQLRLETEQRQAHRRRVRT